MQKSLWIALVAFSVAIFPAGCSDDDDTGGDAVEGGDTGSDTGSDTSGTADTDDDSPDPVDTGPDVVEDAPVDEPDSEPEDTGPDSVSDVVTDAEADAETDAETDAEEDPGPVQSACQEEGECPELYACVDEACTLNPEGRLYLEYNYQLTEPAALTNIVSFFKGFFSDVGFFMTHFQPLTDGEMEVIYGGADQVLLVEDGLDLYRWQLPDELPSFRAHRLSEDVDPLQSDTWESDVFTYELVALFGDVEPRPRLGFLAEQTVVTARFNADLSQIVEGNIRGYITRAEAERRFLDIADNCLLQQGACPTVDCENETLNTLADILDCNEVEMDSDIDDVPGPDAYRAAIYFQSNQVALVE